MSLEFLNPGYDTTWNSGTALRIGGILTNNDDYSSRLCPIMIRISIAQNFNFKLAINRKPGIVEY